MKNKNILFIVFFVLFVFSLDFFIGKVYSLFYFSDASKNNSRMIHSVMETNEEVLIFGSSRALHHYNPKIIEDSLKLTCYNVGYGGQNIYYHLALLKAALHRNTPKFVVLELLTIDFEQTAPGHDKEKLSTLLPFVNKSKSSRQAVLLRGNSESLKLKSSIYPFNSQQYITLRNNFYPLMNDYNGFIPIDKVFTGDLKVATTKQGNYDNNKLDALYEFIEICQEKNINLFICVSPTFTSKIGVGNYADIDMRLQNKFNLKIHNFESDSLFLNNPNYFADPIHLSKFGADVYTSLIVDILQKKKNKK
tara:strand:- start:552 stop:1469 length:918 start_codon:yes stop_codon:yes gene_type:complete